VKRWVFGVEPLPQSLEAAPLLRRIAGLVMSLEAPHSALDRLTAALRTAEEELAPLAPRSSTPRVGRAVESEGRIYVDHARDIGAYNPCFPTYEIRIDGQRASGTVSFPIAYEGPPGVVNGGFLAVFFDSIVQHHNCDLGVAGKTTALNVTFRRPTPLVTGLAFEIERSVAEQRITSLARLSRDGVVLCEAEVRAVAGDLAALPEFSPRRPRA
jgi:hypothetical protein